MQSKAVTKYLHTYAEPECAALENFPSLFLRHVLVIPCFRETAEFALRLLSGFAATSDILIIVVINQPEGQEEPLNRALMAFFQNFSTIWQRENLSLFRSQDRSLHWLVVDKFTAGRTLDKKLGVGLARKLGCDLAAALIAEGHCSASWICTTDADASLPTHYFGELISCPVDAVAAVFNVKHVASAHEDEGLLAATERYEKALRYYVDGLAWAGSPYAFPTIGSALAVRIQAYCECRGFPRKAGGEDFYLLNKLAKIGRVHWLKNTSISVQARVSDRVPFGTGPAVKRILDLPDPADFRYYAPETFTELRLWLSYIPQIWQQIGCNREPLETLPAHIQNVLEEAGIHALWAHIRRQVSTQDQCERTIHHWFDAFQTLKFIRRLQELRYPALPLDQCLQLAPFYQKTAPYYQET